jgi:hypothetical protein
MTTEPKRLPKWKIDTMEAAIQDLQRVKVPITASQIHKRTGPSVTLDEIWVGMPTQQPTERLDVESWVCHLPGKPRDRSTNLAPFRRGFFQRPFVGIPTQQLTAPLGVEWRVCRFSLWQAHDGRTNLSPAPLRGFFRGRAPRVMDPRVWATWQLGAQRSDAAGGSLGPFEGT